MDLRVNLHVRLPPLQRSKMREISAMLFFLFTSTPRRLDCLFFTVDDLRSDSVL